MKHVGLVFALSLATGSALAQDVQGTSAGVWVDPAPSSAITTGVGTPNFTWGTGTEGSAASSLSFTAAGGFSANFEEEFKIGSISYFNGTIAGGSGADSIDLRLTLSFTTPALGGVTSDYAFNLLNTTNTADADASADIVQLPSGFGSSFFSISDTLFGVEIVGFKNVVGDGFLTSNPLEFRVRERGTASADLYARVTNQVPAIPEPSTYALMLAGLAAVAFAAKRRRATVAQLTA